MFPACLAGSAWRSHSHSTLTVPESGPGLRGPGPDPGGHACFDPTLIDRRGGSARWLAVATGLALAVVAQPGIVMAANGAHLVRDVNQGTTASNPSNFTTVASKVLLFADDGNHGMELWRSGGTPGTTSIVADILIQPGRLAPRLDGRRWRSRSGAVGDRRHQVQHQAAR